MANVMANVHQYHPSQKISYTGGKKVYLEGMEQVIAEINKEIAQIRGMTEAGLFKAMEHVHRKAEPATPVRTGALISSWFVVGSRKNIGGGAFKLNVPQSVYKQQNASFQIKKMTKSQKKNMRFLHKSTISNAKADLKAGEDIAVVGGYSVPYAGYIHEAIAGKNMARHFSRPGSHAWWLQEAFNNSRDDILKIIKQNVIIR